MSLESNVPVVAPIATEPAPQPATEVVTLSARVREWLKTSLLGTLKSHGISTLKYMCETEVHTYAFSVAANVILAFFPALVLMATISTKVLHSKYMSQALQQLIMAYQPFNHISSDPKIDKAYMEFIYQAVFSSASHFKVSLFSCVMLFITCTGIFLPLEVALNRIWQSKSDRSYIMNQVVSLGLALGCGLFIMMSIMGTAVVLAPTTNVAGFVSGHVSSDTVANVVAGVKGGITFITMKVLALISSILVFFLIYWLLPNAKIPPKVVLPAAVIVGVVFEIARQIFILCLPLLDFRETYGPFSRSVTLIFWSYVCGLLMLGGAHLSAAGHVQKREAEGVAAASTEAESPAIEDAKGATASV